MRARAGASRAGSFQIGAGAAATDVCGRAPGISEAAVVASQADAGRDAGIVGTSKEREKKNERRAVFFEATRPTQ